MTLLLVTLFGAGAALAEGTPAELDPAVFHKKRQMLEQALIEFDVAKVKELVAGKDHLDLHSLRYQDDQARVAVRTTIYHGLFYYLFSGYRKTEGDPHRDKKLVGMTLRLLGNGYDGNDPYRYEISKCEHAEEFVRDAIKNEIIDDTTRAIMLRLLPRKSPQVLTCAANARSALDELLDL